METNFLVDALKKDEPEYSYRADNLESPAYSPSYSPYFYELLILPILDMRLTAN